jgi:hypothetical protein
VENCRKNTFQDGEVVPLTRKVTFQAKLQKGGMIQVPKLVRWQFKMESDQVLRIGVSAVNLGRGWQFFFGRMTKAGCVRLVKTALSRLQNENESLAGCVFEVTLEPA